MLGTLREVGEYTEASYHYPQGTHIGHILSILSVFGAGQRDKTHLNDEYIRLRGGLGEGRLSTYRRQKYKLQAAMELGILTDDRNYPEDTGYVLDLTPLGRALYTALKPLLNQMDLEFPRGNDGIPSTRMRMNEADFNTAIRQFLAKNNQAQNLFFRVFLNMHAVQQILAFLYHICRSRIVHRNEIYDQFFQAPFVKQSCDREGISEASFEASKRRCPFLLNILDACGIIRTDRSEITIQKLVLMPSVVAAWPASVSQLADEDISIVRELFGPSFLTDEYYLQNLLIIPR